MILSLTPADIFALSLLSVMFLSLAAVFSLFYTMSQKAKKAAREPDLFEGIIEHPTKTQKTPSQENNHHHENLKEWEKQADWWKS